VSPTALNLAGKRILITGASSGIGRETARLIASLGAKVRLSGRNAERLNETLEQLEGSDHHVYAFDLGNHEEIPGWIAGIARESGPLDGLFHAAGEVALRPVGLTKPKGIDALFRSSIAAGLLLVRGFVQRGVAAETSASVVLMSSVAAARGQAGMAVYSAAKAALEGAARSLAVELAPRRIRVNTLAAGAVRTAMHNQITQRLPEAAAEAYEQKHLLGFGAPEDVARSAAFLLSDWARWITGTTLTVDGGYTCR